MTHSTKNTPSTSLIKTALLTLCLSAGAVAQAQAATLDVCASGCTYSSVKTAVNAAASGDVVELAPETFNEGGIFINKHLTIRSASGQATVDGGSARYTFQVLPGKLVSFEDLRIKGGTDCRLDNLGFAHLSTVYVLGTGSGNPSSYGGILNQSSGNMTISDSSVISANASTGFGGGITNLGDLLIQNSTVIGNSGHRGGGVYNYQGTVSVLSSSFSFNQASYKGGAWANVSSAGTFAFHSSSSYSGNTAATNCDKYWNVGGTPSCVN